MDGENYLHPEGPLLDSPMFSLSNPSLLSTAMEVSVAKRRHITAWSVQSGFMRKMGKRSLMSTLYPEHLLIH